MLAALEQYFSDNSYLQPSVLESSLLSVLYRGTETNTNIRIAEGDAFTLICRVGYRSKMETGTWPPVLRWFDVQSNQELSSGPVSAPANTVRRDALITATKAMHGKRFRCHTSYNEPDPLNSVGSNTSTHIYSTIPPVYVENKDILINVDCKFIILFHFSA